MSNLNALSMGRGSFMSIMNELYAYDQHSGTNIIRYATNLTIIVVKNIKSVMHYLFLQKLASSSYLAAKLVFLVTNN